MKAIERFFELILWNARLIVLVPVVFSLILSVGIFLTTTADVLALLGRFAQYLDPALASEARAALQIENIAKVVAIVDSYLLAAIMFIFALGMYELFVNRIDIAENTPFAARLLLIQSLDDLKDRLANVILLILIVKFFQLALKLKYETTLDLLILSVGVVLIAGTLYLSGRARPAYKNAAAKDDGAG